MARPSSACSIIPVPIRSTIFTPSQLANETAPVYDIHFKPVEPIPARLTLSMTF